MAHEAKQELPLFGVSAEFESADALLAAVHALHGQQLGRLDAYTPIPVPGLAAALGFKPEAIRPFAVLGVVLGFAGFMGMCVYALGYAYKFNIGGRPDVSWLSYIVPSFAFALMLAGGLTVLTMVILNRLPRLNHPAFNIPRFTGATQDRFFLAVEALDESFDADAAAQALRGLALQPLAIHPVSR